ncbi:hypothetical protein PROFUN_13873 [Planoprotostelium fungivorum]|uniref:PNO1 second type I KH domain-containing protein n=1 Tax=Planoprotostelium fungivorum TaxID=1890364 RepID=A0A2P6N2V6_9EUKA|nr:hypothetical protein PROFUN_13873 [Planoprotostelium fungivorum]
MRPPKAKAAKEKLPEMEVDLTEDPEGPVEDVEEEEMQTEEVKEVKEVPKPKFKEIKATQATGGAQTRKIPVPINRLAPLRKDWVKIYTPIVEQLVLQIRMNTQSKKIEIRKAADFIEAYLIGFDVEDALALLRLDDLYVESFNVEDVKSLKGEHLSRAIGRIAGSDGKTKFTIENVTKTRLVVADKRIHILGSFANIQTARTAVCDLILGSPPGKVYAKLRSVAGRAKERF